MSTHPNAMLILRLHPDGLTRKTYRAILAELGEDEDSEGECKIAGESYHSCVMEDDYDQENQISAKEGDIVFWDLVTYGYGSTIQWGTLAAQQQALNEWAKGIGERHCCQYDIVVSANYW